MPGRDSCCAPGCSKWRGKSGCEGIPFYRIPGEETVRLTWLDRINRADLRAEHLTDNTRLCSAHFYLGKKSKEQPHPVYFAHRNYPLCRQPPVRTATSRERARSSRPANAVKRPSSAVPAGDHELEDAGNRIEQPAKRSCSASECGVASSSFTATSSTADEEVSVVDVDMDLTSTPRNSAAAKSMDEPVLSTVSVNVNDITPRRLILMDPTTEAVNQAAAAICNFSAKSRSSQSNVTSGSTASDCGCCPKHVSELLYLKFA